MQGWSSASRWFAVFACVAVSGLGFRALEASATQVVDTESLEAHATLPCATFGVAAIDGTEAVTVPGISSGLQDCFGIAPAHVRTGALLPAVAR